MYFIVISASHSLLGANMKLSQTSICVVQYQELVAYRNYFILWCGCNLVNTWAWEVLSLGHPSSSVAKHWCIYWKRQGLEKDVEKVRENETVEMLATLCILALTKTIHSLIQHINCIMYLVVFIRFSAWKMITKRGDALSDSLVCVNWLSI